MRFTRTARSVPAALAAGLMMVGLPLAAAPASAAVAVDRTPDRTVPHSFFWNDAANWADEEGEVCVKLDEELPDGGDLGQVTEEDDSVWQMGTPADGEEFSLLVLKAGQTNDVWEDPTPGALYGTESEQAISHVIVCTRPAGDPDEEVTPIAPTYVDPTCENGNTAGVVLPEIEGVDYGVVGEEIPGGWVSITAVAQQGYEFAEGVQSTWTHSFPVAEDCSEEPSVADPIFIDPTCENDNTADVIYEEVDGVVWSIQGKVAPGETVVVTAQLAEPEVIGEGDDQVVISWSRSWQHTFAEAEDCSGTEPSLKVVAKQPICKLDVPYLSYELLVTGTESDTATITFLNPDGDDIVYADQPLAGELLWPGAAFDEATGKATDWPGWRRDEKGAWVEGDEYDWVRPTVQVRFQVNPEATVTVDYPKATSECAGPQIEVLDVVAEEPTAEPEALASTGAPAAGLLLRTAALLLLLGSALVLMPRLLTGRR